MSADNKNMRGLWNTLKENGYEPPVYEQFQKDMNDEGNLQRVYKTLQDEGYTPPEFDVFKADMGFAKADTVMTDDAKEQMPVSGVAAPAAEQEYVEGFVPGMKQGADALYQGLKSAAGEVANLATGSQRDYGKALEQLDEMVGAGYDLKDFNAEQALKDYRKRAYDKDMAAWEETMKNRRAERENMGFLDAIGHRMSDPSRPRDPFDRSARSFSAQKLGDEVQLQRAYRAIQDALQQSGGNVDEAYRLLGREQDKETWGDETSREAREALADMKPTKGFGAWAGNMVPQMAGNVLALGASLSPWTRWLARPLGAANMAALTASTAGSSMAEARMYGEETGVSVSEGDVLRSGAVDAAIELGTEYIPFSRYFGRVQNYTKKAIGNVLGETVQNSPKAFDEAAALLEEANKELGGKLLSGKNARKFLEDVGVEGMSEFMAEALQTVSPIIYQNPEDYPTLMEVLENGWEGAKGGMFMGAILGGGSNVISNLENRRRRREQGTVTLADGGNEGVVEVLGERDDDTYSVLNGDGVVKFVPKASVKDVQTFTAKEFETGELDRDMVEARAEGEEAAPDTYYSRYKAYKEASDNLSNLVSPSVHEQIDGLLDNEAGSEEISGVLNGLELEQEQAAREYIRARQFMNGAEYAQMTAAEGAVDAFGAALGEYAYDEFTADGGQHRVVTTGNYMGKPVYVKPGKGEYVFVTYEDGREEMALRKNVMDVETSDYKAFMDAYTEKYLNDMEAKFNAQVQNHPKTQEPVKGLVLQNGDMNFMVANVNEDGSVDIVPAGYDKEADAMVPKQGAAVQTVSHDTAMMLQNEYWDAVDAASAAAVSLQRTQSDTEGIVQGTTESATATENEPKNNRISTENDPQTTEIAAETTENSNLVEGSSVGEGMPSPTPVGVPLDEKGDKVYYRAPIDVTLQDIEAEGLEADEVDAFVSANRSEADKLLKKLQGKAPKMSTNIAKYKQEKAAWQEQVADAQAQVDYWANVDAAVKESRVKPGDKTAEEILSMGEPMDGYELAAQMLANGGLPLLRDSYQRETGFGDKEVSSMFGLFRSRDKGGMTVEEAGEVLMQADRENGTNFFDQNDPNAGRDALIDVLSSVRTRGGFTQYIQNNRERVAERERAAEAERDAELKEAWVQENFHMSAEEYDAYMERLEKENPFEGVDLQEIDAIFADAAIEYEQYINNVAYEQGRTNEVAEGGNSVLPEQQTGDTAGTGAVEEGRYTGEDGSEVAGNDAAAQEGARWSEVASEWVSQHQSEIEAKKAELEGLVAEINGIIQGKRVNIITSRDEIEALSGYGVFKECVDNILLSYDEDYSLACYDEYTDEIFVFAPKCVYYGPSVNYERGTIIHENIHSLSRGDIFSKEEFARYANLVMEAYPGIAEYVDAVYENRFDFIKNEEIVARDIELIISSGYMTDLFNGEDVAFEGDTDELLSERRYVVNLLKDRKHGKRTEVHEGDEIHATSENRKDGTGVRSEANRHEGQSVLPAGGQGTLGEGEVGGLSGRGRMVSEVSGTDEEGRSDEEVADAPVGDFFEEAARIVATNNDKDFLEKAEKEARKVFNAAYRSRKRDLESGDYADASKGLTDAQLDEEISYYEGLAKENRKYGESNEWEKALNDSGPNSWKQKLLTSVASKAGRAQASIEYTLDNLHAEKKRREDARMKESASIEQANAERMADIENRLTEIENRRIEIDEALSADDANVDAYEQELLSLAAEQQDLEAEHSGLRAMNDESNAALEAEGSNVRFREVEDTDGEKSLVGVHNISVEKFKKAMKKGGFANPSAAVIDISKQGHSGYGVISLVMPSSLVDKKTGRNAGTFAGDAWTPVYPQVEKQFGKDGSERASKDVQSVPKDMQSETRAGINSFMEGRSGDGLAYLYLHEKGKAPELLMVEPKYPKDVRDAVAEISAHASFSYLDNDSKNKVVELFIQQKYDGDRAAYERYLKEKSERLRGRLGEIGNKSLLARSAKMSLDWIEEHGYEYDPVSNFLREVQNDIEHAGTVNDAGTNRISKDTIEQQGLSEDFENWKESLNERYNVQEVIFDGFTPTGRRKYIPNTLENVSRLMKRQGRSGAMGWTSSFSKFASTLLKNMGSLDAIRKKRDLLTPDTEKRDEFRDYWGNVFYNLGLKLNANPSNQFDDSGLARLEEAALQKNPQAYIKKEYGIDFSDEDAAKLKEMIEAIRTEYPANYFETKFERPVMLNEFAASVVPADVSEDVVQALRDAGLPVYTYEQGNEVSRNEAVQKASEQDGIRFRFIGEKGAANLDAAEEATTRLDNLAVARDMERAFAEKKARVEKLRKSEPVKVQFDGEYELNRSSAKEWLKGNIRGEYTNKDTGDKIEVSKVGINEVTSHGSQDEAHLKSLSSIPRMIENSIFIDEIPNSKDHDKYDSYRYYVCGLKIDGVDYTVKIVVGVKGNSKFYDHRLTQIEKGNLIDNLNGLSNSVAESQNALYSVGKDTKLLSILQTNEQENARKIKMATGWERGADGKWRYETADGMESVASKLVSLYNDSRKDTKKTRLSEILGEHELLSAYPELADLKVRVVNNASNNAGSYNHSERALTVNIGGRVANEGDLFEEDVTSTFVHEIQHAIQSIEGFARGGNASNPAYKKLAGEVESRNVEHRMDMTEEERRMSLASETEDVSREDQIFLDGALGVSYSIRETPAPKKTGKGYKVFVLKNGQLYPPMVANPNGAATPVGVWLDADAAPIAGESKTGRPQVKAGGKGTQGGSGKLAYRPGWHLGVIPYAKQFNRLNPETGEKELFPANFVWAEVEYAADRNYQEEAHEAGVQPSGKYSHALAGLKYLPTDGYYTYRTNPDPTTDDWVITGAMKVTRILKPSEVDEMVREAGREPQPRQAGAVTDEQVDELNKQLAEDSSNPKRESEGGVPASTPMKRSAREQKRHEAYREREHERIRQRVKKLSGVLGLDGVVEAVEDASQLPPAMRRAIEQGRRVKGMYDVQTGKIYIWLPGHTSAFDVEQTLLHEAVAHKGLRALFGKQFDTFLDNVYRAAEPAIRAKIAALAEKHGWNVRVATEEYLASLAETTDFENVNQSWWRKIKELFIDLLHKIGFEGFSGVTLTDNELRYLLWRSYENLRDPNGRRSIFGTAKDVTMQNSLGVGNYAADVSAPAATAADSRYRSGEKNNRANVLSDGMESVSLQQIKEKEDDRQMENLPGRGDALDGKDETETDNTGRNDSPAAENGRSGRKKQPLLGNDIQRGQGSKKERTGGATLNEVNRKFNEELGKLTEENADSIVLSLGSPSDVLLSAGVEDKPMKLYGSKVVKKMKKHGFTPNELHDLPLAIAEPIAVFDNLGREGNRSILTELRTNDGNFLVTLDLGKGEDIDFNIVSSVFGKSDNKIVNWINKGFATYIDKKKALNYLHLAAPIAAASNNQELYSATKIVENFENPSVEGENFDENVRFREDDVFDDVDVNAVARETGTARAMYERTLNTAGYKFQEAWQDSMLGLKALQDAVAKATRGRILDFENAYIAENALSSKGLAEMRAYRELVYKPLLQEVKKLMDAGMPQRGISEYLMAKHGIERNREMAVRKVLAEDEETRAANLERWNEEKHRIWESGGTWEEQQRELDELSLTFGADMSVDYSGFTELFAEEGTNMDEWTETAYRYVQNVEDEYDMGGLMEAVNKATDATLSKQRESGLMDKATYDAVKGMYQYYVPLRGWEQTTADEVYDYLTTETSSFNAPLRTAKGRKSQADDPIAAIGNIAESGILQGNRNLMKQKFLTMAQNHRTDLVSVSDVWVEKKETIGTDGNVTEEWVAVFPTIPADATAKQVDAIVQKFNERMEAKSKEKDATVKRVSDKVDVPYKILPKNLSEHQVLVKQNGKPYVLTINGNPRAAQALNGLTNPDRSEDLYVQVTGAMNRFMAANFTQRNPAFVIGNMFRDGIYANSTVWVKENGAYAWAFNKNWTKSVKEMSGLVRRYKAGKLDMSNATDRLFAEFVENGGETGYTFINSVEDYKGLISDELKKMGRGKLSPAKAVDWVGEAMDTFGRWAEDASRFAAYRTSREQGRSIARSIADAKEISVNFNKKGAGRKTTGKFEKGNYLNALQGWLSQTFRGLYIFWNAGVQGLTNFGRLAKNNPKKFAGLGASYLALGSVMPFVNAALAGAMGGDDGEDDYYNLPEYVRRNNLCLYAGPLGWITIPLPIELRALYGLGELTSSVMSGEEKFKPMKVAEQFSQIMPIDMMEGGGGFSAFVPSYIKPMWEAYNTNLDWTGVPIYKENDFNKEMPEWTKAYKSTSPELVALSEVLNEWTGGTKYRTGAVDLNPARIEHLFEGYLGGVGSFINQAKKTAMMPFDEDLQEMRNVPVLGRFIKSADTRTEQRKINEDYFDNVERFDLFRQELNGYKKEMKMPRTDSFESAKYVKLYNDLRQSEDYQKFLQWQAMQKQLNKMNEAFRKTGNEELERQMFLLKDAMNEVAK